MMVLRFVPKYKRKGLVFWIVEKEKEEEEEEEEEEEMRPVITCLDLSTKYIVGNSVSYW